MSDRIEILGEELDSITGGQITYTWDGTVGTIGINGNNPFILVDKDKFIAYYNSVQGTMRDSVILTNLLNQGVIKKP